jgi:hypothetical protein
MIPLFGGVSMRDDFQMLSSWLNNFFGIIRSQIETNITRVFSLVQVLTSL